MTHGHNVRSRTVLHATEVSWGGVRSLLDHYLRHQVQQGMSVHLVAPSAMRDMPGRHHEWALRRDNLLTYPVALRQLRRQVRRIRPDVVHLHSFYAGFMGRLHRPLSLGAVPVVYQPHGWSDQLFSSPELNSLVKVAERSFAHRTDHLVANNADEISHGGQIGVHLPATPLGLAVSLTRFRRPTPEERSAARRELALGSQSLVLVLGRLARQKGQDLLVPAWEQSPPPNALLAMVGPGDPHELQRLAPRQWNRSVVAPGEPADVLTWLRAADVLALPSRYEAGGVVVAEAMGMGIPVVSTAVDGAREMIEQGSLPAAGEVVPLADMDAFLGAVRRRLVSPELREAEGAAGVRRATRLFDPASVCARLDTAYEATIAAYSARNGVK